MLFCNCFTFKCKSRFFELAAGHRSYLSYGKKQREHSAKHPLLGQHVDRRVAACVLLHGRCGACGPSMLAAICTDHRHISLYHWPKWNI